LLLLLLLLLLLRCRSEPPSDGFMTACSAARQATCVPCDLAPAFEDTLWAACMVNSRCFSDNVGLLLAAQTQQQAVRCGCAKLLASVHGITAQGLLHKHRLLSGRSASWWWLSVSAGARSCRMHVSAETCSCLMWAVVALAAAAGWSGGAVTDGAPL